MLFCVVVYFNQLCLNFVEFVLYFYWVIVFQREQVNFQWDDDEVRFVLDQHAELDFYCASSLKQQSAGRHVAPLGHIYYVFYTFVIYSVFSKFIGGVMVSVFASGVVDRGFEFRSGQTKDVVTRLWLSKGIYTCTQNLLRSSQLMCYFCGSRHSRWITTYCKSFDSC
jgi:hypothetical protein